MTALIKEVCGNCQKSVSLGQPIFECTLTDEQNGLSVTTLSIKNAVINQ